jgi:hypothetical protein
VIGVCPDDSPGASGNLKARIARRVALDLDSFVWEALKEESAQLGVSIAELASFAVAYYLADHDSGRIARRLPKSQSLGSEPHPLGELLTD